MIQNACGTGKISGHQSGFGSQGIDQGLDRLCRRSSVFGSTLVMAAVALVSACTSAAPMASRGLPVGADMRQSPTAEAAVYRNETMLQTADRLAAAGDYAAALPLYRSLASAGSPKARLGLARAFIELGRPEGAYDLSQSCTSSCGNDMMVIRGESAMALGRYDEARSAFERAVYQRPSNKGVAGLGVTQALTGAYEAAIATFEKLPAPKGPGNKALVLIAIDRAAEGRDILEQMVRDGTAGLKERQNLVLAYVLLGNNERARSFAQLDLDLQTALETLAFYRQLAALSADKRLKALVTGSLDPRWTRRDAGNFIAKEQERAEIASARLLAPEPQPVQLVMAEPEPLPEPEPQQERETLPENAPPLLEPEGWAVQLAAYRKIQNLISGWDELRADNMDILETIPPRRSEVDFGADGRSQEGPKGFYYRLNAGPLDTLAEARTLCKTLILRGTECWVRPPEQSEGRLPDASLAD